MQPFLSCGQICLFSVEEKLDVIVFPHSFSFPGCYRGSSQLSSLSRWQEGKGVSIMQTVYCITAEKTINALFNLNSILLLNHLCSYWVTQSVVLPSNEQFYCNYCYLEKWKRSKFNLIYVFCYIWFQGWRQRLASLGAKFETYLSMIRSLS